MNYDIIWVNGHVEVYDSQGAFCFSADTRREAMEELAETAWACRGYCDLTIVDGVLTGITPREAPPLPEQPPTDTEVLNVLLGVM